VSAVAASAFFVACGGGSKESSTSSTSSTKETASSASGGAGSAAVSIELSEWGLKASSTGKAGKLEFSTKNAGSTPHELLVVKGDDATTLTKTASGVVDEAKYPPLGRTKQIAPGSTEKLDVSLTAGKYVLFCNIAGHYDLGMRAAFTVN
jgi:uncharacterized cupredoxin-like copper-binding protein